MSDDVVFEIVVIAGNMFVIPGDKGRLPVNNFIRAVVVVFDLEFLVNGPLRPNDNFVLGDCGAACHQKQ
jgi:hypothetical protein